MSDARTAIDGLVDAADYAEQQRLRAERAEGDVAELYRLAAEVARILDPAVMHDAWGLRAAALKVLRERDHLQRQVEQLRGERLLMLAALKEARDGEG